MTALEQAFIKARIVSAPDVSVDQEAARPPVHSATHPPRRSVVPKLTVVAAQFAVTPPAEVTRTRVWDGSTVTIKVPREAKFGAVTGADGKKVEYLQYCRTVSGGVVNMFLHLEGAAANKYLGKDVLVSVEVWVRELADGRQFLYVDLRPVKAVLADYTLSVVQGEVPERYRRNRNAVVFDAFAPLQGAVVLVKK